MTVQKLIEMLTARLAYMQAQRLGAEQRGDMPALIAAEAEIAETETTLAALRTL